MSATGLQSTDRRDLLDIIDKLRSQGFSNFVDLPEIIVCGDQSSGKSSVLEAISGMSFPTNESLCTRFATELVLRRQPVAGVRVSIIPGDDRFADEKKTIEEWRPKVDPESEGLRDVIDEATAVMGLPHSKVYSKDILRVELSGPTRPHLTMVDLPGLFRAGSKEQSVEHAQLVKGLVERYMRSPRSVILAVVSAKNEYVLQDVTALASAADPEGLRTIGLITKPDTLTLDSGPESQRWWVGLAQNQNVELQLGWHVLKNRSYGQRDFSSSQRDDDEARFFSEGAWASIDPSRCGVRSLKDRLSAVLKRQILRQLPSLVRDVEDEIEACTGKLARLGDQRQSPQDQARYLSKVSEDFTRLTWSAVQGMYTDEFFGDTRKFDYGKRLRAAVQNRLGEFADEMREDGQSQEIVESDGEDMYEPGDGKIKRSTYLEEIKSLVRRSKGCELPGLFSPLIVNDLFVQQCWPWPDITARMTEDVLDCVYRTTRLVLDKVAVEEVAEEIMVVINKGVERLKADVDRKIGELHQTHVNLHAITYNRQLTENVQRAQRERHRRAMKKKIRETFKTKGFDDPDHRIPVNPAQILDLFSDEIEPDMDRFGSSIVVDYMQAYYKVALDRYVDDVGVLAIEDCLISKLPSLFTPGVVRELPEADVTRMVGESESAAQEREALGEKRKILEEGLQGLKRLHRHRDGSNLNLDVEDSSRPLGSLVSRPRRPTVTSMEGPWSPDDRSVLSDEVSSIDQDRMMPTPDQVSVPAFDAFNRYIGRRERLARGDEETEGIERLLVV